MDQIDGWAIVIGDNACRYFAQHNHDALEGIFCSDGSYSAGWRLFAASVALTVLGVVLFKMLRPGP